MYPSSGDSDARNEFDQIQIEQRIGKSITLREKHNYNELNFDKRSVPLNQSIRAVFR